MKVDLDYLVVGAGVVGLSVSEHLSRSSKVALVDKQYTFGMGNSSRNSEVIHSGIYYPKLSKKSQFSWVNCVSWNRKPGINLGIGDS